MHCSSSWLGNFLEIRMAAPGATGSTLCHVDGALRGPSDGPRSLKRHEPYGFALSGPYRSREKRRGFAVEISTKSPRWHRSDAVAWVLHSRMPQAAFRG